MTVTTSFYWGSRRLYVGYRFLFAGDGPSLDIFASRSMRAGIMPAPMQSLVNTYDVCILQL